MEREVIHGGNVHALALFPDAFDANELVLGIAQVRQLMADAQARGYAACQADVVEHLRSSGVADIFSDDIEDGRHIGKAKP